MEIKVITDQNYQKTWDKFVIDNSSPADFLQSFEWGEFREKLGEKILRFAVYDSTQIDTDGTDERGLIAVAQFVYQKLPLGRQFLFCPRGPIIKCLMSNDKYLMEDVLKLLINEIKKITEKERVVFVRMELPDATGSFTPLRSIQDDILFSKPKILTHSKNPENTLLLDLTKSEEEILAGMHPKWRYNIRLAEKRGVSIKCQMSNFQCQNKDGKQKTENDLNIFYGLLQETAKRDGIKIFSKKYYEDLINFEGCHPAHRLSAILLTAPSAPLPTRGVGREAPPSKGGDNHPGSSLSQHTDELRINLFFTEYNNKILSSIMLLSFGDTVTYLHGGSANENREVMPNHLIQWTAIKWAKENGYKWYDFWGIQGNTQNTINRTQEINKKNKSSKNNWEGITRFKMGFVNKNTGQEINYFGARDLVINKMWYNLYRLEKLIQF